MFEGIAWVRHRSSPSLFGSGLEDSGSAEDQTMAFREKREILLGSCMSYRKDVWRWATASMRKQAEEGVKTQTMALEEGDGSCGEV